MCVPTGLGRAPQGPRCDGPADPQQAGSDHDSDLHEQASHAARLLRGVLGRHAGKWIFCPISRRSAGSGLCSQRRQLPHCQGTRDSRGGQAREGQSGARDDVRPDRGQVRCGAVPAHRRAGPPRQSARTAGTSGLGARRVPPVCRQDCAGDRCGGRAARARQGYARRGCRTRSERRWRHIGAVRPGRHCIAGQHTWLSRSPDKPAWYRRRARWRAGDHARPGAAAQRDIWRCRRPALSPVGRSVGTGFRRLRGLRTILPMGRVSSGRQVRRGRADLERPGARMVPRGRQGTDREDLSRCLSGTRPTPDAGAIEVSGGEFRPAEEFWMPPRRPLPAI